MKRLGRSGAGNNPTESWRRSGFSQAPLPEPAVLQAEPLVAASQTARTNSRPFDPILIIGLGQLGMDAIAGWKKIMIGGGGFDHDAIRIMRFYHGGLHSKPVEEGRGWISLNVDLSRSNRRNLQPGGFDRQQARDSFNDAECFESVKQFISRQVVGHQRHDVYLIGSLHDPLVGMVGEILETLDQVRDRLGSIQVLISAATSEEGNGVADEDAYAALREISRFTFDGPHIMSMRGNQRQISYHNLIDDLYLVERPELNEGSKGHDPSIDATLLAETLYVLTHPAHEIYRQHQLNATAKGGSLRGIIKEPVIHSLAVATLHLPLADIIEYSKIRLTSELLLGSEKEAGWWGSEYNPSDFSNTAETWLRSDFCAHPFFEWLLDWPRVPNANGMPETTDEHLQAFKKKLSYHVTEYLNDDQHPGRLLQVAGCIDYIAKKFTSLAQGLNKARLNEGDLARRDMIISQLNEYRLVIEQLILELGAWLDAIDEESSKRLTGPTTPSWSAFRNRSETEPIKTRESSKPLKPARHEIGAIRTFLGGQLNRLTEQVSLMRNGPISRSVLDEVGERSTLEYFYLAFIRSDKLYDGHPDQLYKQLRKQIGWWLTIDAVGRLTLKAICRNTNAGQQLDGGAFGPADSNRFLVAVQEMCEGQLHHLRPRILSGLSDWFVALATRNKRFLALAQKPFIRYDRNYVFQLQPNGSGLGESRGYCISPRPLGNDEFAREAFQTTLGDGVEVIVGDAHRVSLFLVVTNIPLGAITGHQRRFRAYITRRVQHSYDAEQTARGYEKLLQQADWENKYRLFCPQFTQSLTHPQLVRLYFRCLISELIYREESDGGFDKITHWVVSQVGRFEPMQLARAEMDTDIYKAYKTFVLDSPFKKDNTNRSENTHSTNFVSYLTSLSEEVEKRSRDEKLITLRSKEIEPQLQKLELIGKTDREIEDFAKVFRIELENLWQPLSDNFHVREGDR